MPSKALPKAAGAANLDAPATPAAPSQPVLALEPQPASYEAAVAELDALVAHMQAGQLPLDQLLVNYQRGAALLAFCRARLAAVEEQVKVLEDGQLKPWVGAGTA